MFSAVKDIAPGKAFIVHGREESHRLKPEIEASGLKSLQEILLEGEQEERGAMGDGAAKKELDVNP